MNLFKSEAPFVWHFIGMTIGLLIWFAVIDQLPLWLSNPWYVRYGISGLVGAFLWLAIEFAHKLVSKKSESSQ